MKKPLLIIAFVVSVFTADAQPGAAEYAALIELYNSTNGPNWTNNTGWSTANPNVVQSVNGWYGIEVDQQGHVIELDLVGNNLVGSIPPTIGSLLHLWALQLGNNNLSGPIPSSVGGLINITRIQLAG